METLTPEEELLVVRLTEEIKRYPRLRRPLIEALQMTELLDVPQQLIDLRTLVEQILQTQAEHGARLERIEKVADEAKKEAQEAKKEAQEAKKEAQEAKRIASEVRERVDRIERDVATLKGNSEELHAAKRMPGVFGKYLRKLRIYDTHQFGLIVEDMFQLSDEDYAELLRADWFAQALYAARSAKYGWWWKLRGA